MANRSFVEWLILSLYLPSSANSFLLDTNAKRCKARKKKRAAPKSLQFPVNPNANDANLQALLNLKSALFFSRGFQSET